MKYNYKPSDALCNRKSEKMRSYCNCTERSWHWTQVLRKAGPFQKHVPRVCFTHVTCVYTKRVCLRTREHTKSVSTINTRAFVTHVYTLYTTPLNAFCTLHSRIVYRLPMYSTHTYSITIHNPDVHIVNIVVLKLRTILALNPTSYR